MTQIRTLEEAQKVLANYIPHVSELLGKDLTLQRMKPMLAVLGNPETKLKIIHVAGTSGKTSTAYYVTALLKEAGVVVGLTISPHLDSVIERVQINLEPLPEPVFCKALSEFLELISQVEPKPTYFELLIAFVYWYFAKIEVDYAVIETGLGGSFDATNVAGNSNKVCVLTDIGLDHMHVLGDTLAEIARQKAGIIYPQNQVFSYQQSSVVMRVFEAEVAELHAILNVLSDYDDLSRGVPKTEIVKLPQYQQRNWLLAKKVYDYIVQRDNLPVLEPEQLVTSMQVKIPGRMDIWAIDGKTLVMDGAHNEQKMTAFVASFQALYPNQKATVVLALKKGKEYETVLPLLEPICSNLIVTSFDTFQDLPIVSIEPELLAREASRLGFKNVKTEHDYIKAYELANSSSDDIVVITGSFYLLSSLRTVIIQAHDKAYSSIRY